MRSPLLLLATFFFGVFSPFGCLAEAPWDQPPISYNTETPHNCVSELQSRIDSGKFTLLHNEPCGYLESVLRGLRVPIESQTLVFSKTSLQVRCISPRTPRAIYFSDEVYVGFCQSGEVLEISVVDPQLGTVFYTLNQEPTNPPRFERRIDNCLICHSSSRTEAVPGHLLRSLYVDTSGTPLLSSTGRMVDHTTPLAERWGGWYVTGQHGPQKHLGNLMISGRRVSPPIDNSTGQNVTSLNECIDLDRYLSPHSDIVALMVLEHQALVQNRITKANFVTRQALASDELAKEVRDPTRAPRLENTTRRIQSVGDNLLDALLFVGETQLTSPIRGSSSFAKSFGNSGPFDDQGRSLRDLDLQTRLFKHPCSYLIYSAAFDALPDEVKTHIWQRLGSVLTGEDLSAKFAHLTKQDREAILQIVCTTKKGLPEDWPQRIARSGTTLVDHD